MDSINILNPFSDNYHALKIFKQLDISQKIKTIALTALASLASAFIGTAVVFRLLVSHYTKTILLPPPSTTLTLPNPFPTKPVDLPSDPDIKPEQNHAESNYDEITPRPSEPAPKPITMAIPVGENGHFNYFIDAQVHNRQGILPIKIAFKSIKDESDPIKIGDLLLKHLESRAPSAIENGREEAPDVEEENNAVEEEWEQVDEPDEKDDLYAQGQPKPSALVAISHAHEMEIALQNAEHPAIEKKYRLVLNSVVSALTELHKQEGLAKDLGKSIHDQIEALYAIDVENEDFKMLFDTLRLPQNFASPKEQRYALLKQLNIIAASDYYKVAFVDYLKALEKNGNLQEHMPIQEVHAIAQAIFTEVHMHKFACDLISNLIAFKAADSMESLVDVLEQDFKAIEDAPKWLKTNWCATQLKKIQIETGFYYNPLEDTNFASVLYEELHADKTVKCLHLATPTNQIPLRTTQIINTFRLFLDSYQAQGKVHLYFNHQDPISKWVGDESAGVKAINDLQGEYPKNFFVFNMPMDGAFFEQKDKYAASNQAEPFIEAFQNELRLPEKIKEALKGVLLGVWQDFFAGKAELSQNERVSFQLLAYVRLQECACQLFNADSYNASGKDSVDRGAIMNGLKYLCAQMQGGVEIDHGVLDNFRVILHSPAFMVKNQAIICSRRAHLLDVLKILQGLDLAALKKIQNERKEMSYKTRFGMDGDQDIYPRCALAQTLTEYEQALNLETAGNNAPVIQGFINAIVNQEVFIKYVEPVLNYEDVELPCQLFKDAERQTYVVNGTQITGQNAHEIVSSLYGKLLQLTNNNAAMTATVAKLCTQSSSMDMTLKFWEAIPNNRLERLPKACTKEKLIFKISKDNNESIIMEMSKTFNIVADGSEDALFKLLATTTLDLALDRAVIKWHRV